MGRAADDTEARQVLLERWEAQQARYLPEREKRFELICDVLAALGPSEPRVLDLCAGPGSLTARILDRFPSASVLAVDVDPAHVELGRGRFDERVSWHQLDLREHSWDEQFAEDSFDAVVSATAIHWFTADEVVRLYRQLARLLRGRGVFANADHLPVSSPTVAKLGDELVERWQEDQLRDAEDYYSYRDALRLDADLREHTLAGDELLGKRHPGTTLPIEFHRQALLVAGFAEAGEIWRLHRDAVLVALR